MWSSGEKSALEMQILEPSFIEGFEVMNENREEKGRCRSQRPEVLFFIPGLREWNGVARRQAKRGG